jgi:hypothetical protein
MVEGFKRRQVFHHLSILKTSPPGGCAFWLAARTLSKGCEHMIVWNSGRRCLPVTLLEGYGSGARGDAAPCKQLAGKRPPDYLGGELPC